MDVNNIASTFIKSTWILLTTLLVFLTWYTYRSYNYWSLRGVPYAKPFLFFGNLSFIMRKSIFDYFHELAKKYPMDYFGVYLGLTPALVVQTPELAKKVLVTDSERFQDRHCYSSYAGDPLGSLNLFTLKNPLWSEMRYKLSPLFTSARLKMLAELMNVNAAQLVKKVQRDYVDQKKTVNLKELFSMYTSDTVGYSVFGLRVSVLSSGDSPLWLITRHLVKWTFWRGFEFTMIFLMPIVAHVMRLKFFSPTATEYIKQMFSKVYEERQKSGTQERDLMHQLISIKDGLKLPADADADFSDNLMTAQAAVFILGSIETSTTTLTALCHELAHHPEVQEKVYQEIDEALKSKGKEVLEYNDILDLKYLTACALETLRKYPTLAFLDRKCNKTYKLTDTLTIEAGTPVLINVAAIHKDPRNYEEPDRWMPERFLNSNETDHRQFSFLPFGEGPRFCIGRRYGLLQVRVGAAQLLRKFRVAPGAGGRELRWDPCSVITSTNHGSVQFIPRN